MLLTRAIQGQTPATEPAARPSVPGPTPVEVQAQVNAFSAAARAFQDGFYERAEKEFAAFVEKYPDSPRLLEAVLLQARAALQQRKLATAEKLLQTYLPKAQALSDQYQFWLGQVYYEQGDYEKAAQTFRSLIQSFPNSIRLLEASYSEARARFKLRQWPRVIELLQKPDGTFQKELKNRPSDELVVRGYLLLSEALLENGEPDAAREVLQNLPQTLFWTSDLQWQRAYLLVRIEEARQRWQEALTLSTNLMQLAEATGLATLKAESWNLRGRMLEHLNQPLEAIATYTNLLTTNTPAAYRRDALVRIIALQLDADDLPAATASLDQFLQQFPADRDSDAALLTRGEIALKQYWLAKATNAVPVSLTNLLAQAMQSLQRLLTNAPQSTLAPRAQLGLGWCFWEQNRIPEAQRAFAAAVQGLPHSREQAIALFKLADTEFRQQQYTNALTHYRQILKQYAKLPDLPSHLWERALYQTLRTSLLLQDIREAEAAMLELLNIESGTPLAQRGTLVLGQGLVRLGRPTEARRVLSDFLDRFPNSPLRPEVELALARALAREKHWDEALKLYDAWIKRYPTNASLPEVAFARAWTCYQAGRETNALALFNAYTNMFPDHPLRLRAHMWIGDYFYRHEEFDKAESQYDLVIRQTNQPPSEIRYEALMMAGRASVARQAYEQAATRFDGLINDPNCPTNVAARANFAKGDILTLLATEVASTNLEERLNGFKKAIAAFERIPKLYPTSPLVPLAWGRIGQCHYQLGVIDRDRYPLAAAAFRKVIEMTNTAPVSARSLAEIGLGLVFERQADIAADEPVKSQLFERALDHYLNVFYGKNLAPSQEADPHWLYEAGMHAARLAEQQNRWEQAVNIYTRLMTLVPVLQPSLEPRLTRARQQARLQKG